MNNFTGTAVSIYKSRAIARSKCTDQDKLVDLKADNTIFSPAACKAAVATGKRWAVVDMYGAENGPAEGVQKACGGIITTSAKGLKGQDVPVTIRKAVTTTH